MATTFAAATKNSCPTQPPCLSCTFPKEWSFLERFCFRQQGQGTFGRPAPSNFHSQDNQTGRTRRTHQLWITTFLSSAGCLKDHAVLLGAPSMNEACHHNASRTPMWCRQRKAVHHHFQTAREGPGLSSDSSCCLEPSLQMRDAALSRANSLLPNTPDLAHAARWWQNESIGRRPQARAR